MLGREKPFGLKALPKADGFDEILVPGEPEDRTFGERSRNGIPLPPKTASLLRQVGEKLHIQAPRAL